MNTIRNRLIEVDNGIHTPFGLKEMKELPDFPINLNRKDTVSRVRFALTILSNHVDICDEKCLKLNFLSIIIVKCAFKKTQKRKKGEENERL